MTVKTYSVAKSGEARVSTNFKVKEFACHDGTDKVLIDDALVALLQDIRTHFGKPVTITSGYRTELYNASIGSTSSSYHVKGQACDIRIAGIHPVILGMYAESIGAGGIGVYAYPSDGFVHIDSRSAKYRWLTIRKGGGNQYISRIMPTLRQAGSANTINSVTLLQRTLGIAQSGTFGVDTLSAVKGFQRKNHLTEDGIVGKNTWTRMF